MSLIDPSQQLVFDFYLKQYFYRYKDDLIKVGKVGYQSIKHMYKNQPQPIHCLPALTTGLLNSQRFRSILNAQLYARQSMHALLADLMARYLLEYYFADIQAP
jgi:hypothetical protein